MFWKIYRAHGGIGHVQTVCTRFFFPAHAQEPGNEANCTVMYWWQPGGSQPVSPKSNTVLASGTRLPRSQAVGETAWQLLRVQTVTSAAWKLAVPIKFQNAVTTVTTQLHNALNRRSHAHSNSVDHSIALV